MQFKQLGLLALANIVSAQQGNSTTQDLVATLSSQPSLSNLTSFVSMDTELLEGLKGASNITILAPSNEAFAKLLSSPAGEALGMDSGLIRAVLQYHVLNTAVMAADITETSVFVPTMLKNESYANVTGGQVVQAVKAGDQVVFYSGLMMNATVSQADIHFTGGVIHIIDSVLTLPASVLDTAMASNLTALYGAVNATDTVSVVNDTPDVTIFAPTNEAFQAIGSALQNASIEDLQGVLAYHVVAGTVGYSTGLQNGMMLQTANGANLTITIDGEGNVFVNSAKVVVPNVLVANGVVHVIDNVLNPAATAGPSPSATAGTPAFTGASSVSEVPFTSGQPTPTGGMNPPTEATPTDTMTMETGAAMPMKTAAVGAAALFGAGAVMFAGF